MKLTTALLLATLAMHSAASAENTYAPSDAERARWTIGDMHSWAICFGAYQKDHNAFPVTATLPQIAALFQPVYIRVLPLRDAWGTPYLVVSDGTHFRVISAGADREFDRTTWDTPARNLDFGADAVVSDSVHRTWKFE